MKDKLSRFSLISVGILSSLILTVAFIDYVLPVLLPFIIALIIATLTVKPARILSAKINVPEKVIRLITSIVATLIFFSLVAFLVWRVSTALWRFLADMDEGNRLYSMLFGLFSSEVPIFSGLFSPDLASKISSAVGELVSDWLSRLAEWIATFASGLPGFLFFILVTLISLVYFALDYDKIASFISSVLPEKLTATIIRLKNTTLLVIKKYISSYSLIMLITYTVILTGLWILRVDHAFVIAMLIALLDLLPVIGVGTVLIPWSMISFIEGNAFLGVGLIILFAVSTVIRQLIEPKIVGKSLDLHPIVTLMMLYIGFSLFGFLGMIILPVIAVSTMAFLKRDKSTEVT